MAETAATKTTTPRRPRAAASKAPAAKATTAAKTTATKAAPAKAAAKPADDGQTRVVFSLMPGEETRRYQKFDLSTDTDGNATGCVGTVYAPPGTEEVKVALVGPADVVDPE